MPDRRASRKTRRGYSSRAVDVREPRKRFLIVCEGEKTEPNYFRGFRVPREVVEIRGLDDNTVRLVEKAVELKKNGRYNQTWCVFDRDSFPAAHFNAALALAREEKIQVAYSNEAFELWYLLHFHFYDMAIHRHAYIDKLIALLGHRYEKNSDAIYEKLEPRQPDAIRNAQTLLAQYPAPNPEKDNPSTTVYLLVQELNQYSRP